MSSASYWERRALRREAEARKQASAIEARQRSLYTATGARLSSVVKAGSILSPKESADIIKLAVKYEISQLAAHERAIGSKHLLSVIEAAYYGTIAVNGRYIRGYGVPKYPDAKIIS